MDTIDVDLKTSVDKSNTDLNKTESETQSGTAKAQINANATAKYISVISKHKGLLAESQARTFNQLNSSLNSFVKDSSSIAKESYNKDSAMMGHYRKLTVQVINRDPNLQEKVASDLSSQKEMVRTRDAASVLESDLKNLPKVLSEGTVAGQNLGKFICQSVVNLTDYENMGAGLQRDLAIRQVFAPTEELSLRSKQATAEVLAASIAYVKSNQPEVLTTLKPEQQEIVKPKPGSTTPQIMTRYLRQALDEFPDDSTYLDIFKTTSSENTKTFMGYDDPNNAVAAQEGLKDYDALLDSAASETTDLNARYDRYAQAQAWLEDSSLVIPLTVGNGAAPVISRLTPFTGASMQVGDKNSSDYFKYVKPQEKVVTKKEYEQSREKWLKEKKASNEKAQKDLEKHVK